MPAPPRQEALSEPRLGNKTATRLPPLPPEQTALLTKNVTTLNPHLKYTQQTARGYGVAEVSRDALNVTFKAVDALRQDSPARTIGRFQVASGTPRVNVV